MNRPPARSRVVRPARPEPEAVVLLKKVLDLELRRGCDDRAVVGGLDRYLERARKDRPTRALLAKAPPLAAGYAGLATEARPGWLRAVLAAKPGPAGRGAAEKPGPAPGKAPPARSAPGPPADPLDQPVTVVRGVKAGLQAKLAKLGLSTVRDLIYLFPNRHNDFASIRTVAELEVGEDQTTVVSVWSAAVARLGARPGTQAVVGDQTGTMRVVWFNQPYLADQLHTNDRIVLSGRVSVFSGSRTMESPAKHYKIPG